MIHEGKVALAARVIDDVAADKRLAQRISQIDVSNVLDAVVLLDDDPALLHLGSEKFAERLLGYIEVAAALRQTMSEIDYVDLRFDDRIYARPAGAAAVRTASRPSAKN